MPDLAYYNGPVYRKLEADLKAALPELALPPGWYIQVDSENQVYYHRLSPPTTTYEHPQRGYLPPDWYIRMCTEDDGRRRPSYYNKRTKRRTKDNPRLSDEVLRERRENWKDETTKAIGAVTRMKTGTKLEDLRRQPVKNTNFRNKYYRVHAIDGPEAGKSTGAMNGGVYVVKLKDDFSRLYIEKKFKSRPVDIELAREEIEMLYRLKHGSLTFYIAAFVTDNPPDASVYVEFCDRGSLQDLIDKYQKQTTLKVPERFIWHCFASLCDGLAYLLGGRSYILANDSKPAPGWVPVLHRDIKPDNILLRSRDTVASKRYFYCVISDFGLAGEDRPDHDPKVNKYQKQRSKLGTCTYFAPELCYNPYPKTNEERGLFPPIPNSSDRYKHSPESDLWALGACIYNLASLGEHLTLNGRPFYVAKTDWYEGQASRFESYTLDTKLGYSDDLACAIRRVMRFKKEERPNPIDAIFRVLRPGMDDSGFTTGIVQAGEDELPPWATRVHEYHSKKPIPQTDC